MQYEELRKFLKSDEGKRFDWVWCDWSCMPQGSTAEGRDYKRTDEEKADFERMLSEVNLLYLGCFVLIIMDRSYVSRFWTQVRCRF